MEQSKYTKAKLLTKSARIHMIDSFRIYVLNSIQILELATSDLPADFLCNYREDIQRFRRFAAAIGKSAENCIREGALDE